MILNRPGDRFWGQIPSAPARRLGTACLVARRAAIHNPRPATAPAVTSLLRPDRREHG
jgi:hypothetical protein